MAQPRQVTLLVLVVLFAIQCSSTANFEGGDPADATGDVAQDQPADSSSDDGADAASDSAGDANRDSARDGPHDSPVDTPHGDQREEVDEPVDPGLGTWESPYIIAELPFVHTADTAASTQDVVDRYACAPQTDESGPEVVYLLTAPDTGILAVSVDDSAAGVDVDVHLLGGAEPDTCRVRHNTTFFEVFAGDVVPYLVVDTYVNGAGTVLAGPYTLTVSMTPLPGADCALETGSIELINRPDPLPMPAIGEVVREAHLVTTEEFPDGWPTSSRDGIEAHYAASEAATGYEMERSEPWAPEGEGGSMWGQGSTNRPPVVDETWYVNMYWRSRPDRGTRMLVLNPDNGQAAVAAAGYETGPGSALRIGGVTEEIHNELGSVHRSRLLLGFLVDQELPFGPIDCDQD